MTSADKACCKTPAEIRPPSCFQFGIGGFTGHSWELAWIAGQLWFHEDDHGQGMLSYKPWQPYETPVSKDWRHLRDLLAELNVWEWPKEFLDLDVLDGTQWSLKIKWGRHQKTVYGNNAFPDGFEGLERAIRRLASQADSSREEVARLHR